MRSTIEITQAARAQVSSIQSQPAFFKVDRIALSRARSSEDRLARRAFLRACISIAALCSFPPLDAQQPARPTRVVLLLSGVVNDGGWGKLAAEGLDLLSHDSAFQTALAENVTLAQMQQVARGYSDDGFDLIIGHGFEFGSALMDIAPDYPHQHYFVTTFQPQPIVPSNIMFVNLGYFEAAYAAGALAALISDRRQVVGFVGGGDDPTQHKMKASFIAGAERTVPGIKGLGIITGDYDNAAKGREAASTLIGNGADVLWHAADLTGLGAIEGAVAGKVKVLGCYSDQTSLAPQNMATSFEINLSGIVTTVARAVRNRTFAGGTEWRPPVDQSWLLKAGAHGDHNPALVSAAAWQAFQKLWLSLSNRTISING